MHGRSIRTASLAPSSVSTSTVVTATLPASAFVDQFVLDINGLTPVGSPISAQPDPTSGSDRFCVNSPASSIKPTLSVGGAGFVGMATVGGIPVPFNPGHSGSRERGDSDAVLEDTAGPCSSSGSFGKPAFRFAASSLSQQIQGMARPAWWIWCGALDRFVRRLSDFLLRECAYAELFFTHRRWPEFGVADLQGAIAEFKIRDRRFGAIEATRR